MKQERLQTVSYTHLDVYKRQDKSHTCREKGAGEQYRKNLENNKVQALYRRIDQQKFMTAYRNKESKTIQKEFRCV